MRKSKTIKAITIRSLLFTVSFFMTLLATAQITSQTSQTMNTANNMQIFVQYLSDKIGERNIRHYQNLRAAANYIKNTFQSFGYTITTQEYFAVGKEVQNIIVEIPGSSQPNQIVIIGAHYDSALGSPGADDNGSGIAALLELSHIYSRHPLGKTLRFVAFVNEEAPFFATDKMGSTVYAQQVKQKKENVVAMLSLDSIGYFSTKKGSQKYPQKFLSSNYPTIGDFLGFVSNEDSNTLLEKSVLAFHQKTDLPVEYTAAPEWLAGIGWSDQHSFWQQGYPALMITDTAPFRNPHYHLPSDTWQTIDFKRLSAVVTGLTGVIDELCR